MRLHKAGEDYLKVIYLLHQSSAKVRECDIAASMGLSKASVCNMMKNLSQQGYIFIQAGNVCLTSSGIQKSKEIFDAFLTIQKVLTDIFSVDKAVAEKDACLMEHIISKDTLAAFHRLLSEKE